MGERVRDGGRRAAAGFRVSTGVHADVVAEGARGVRAAPRAGGGARKVRAESIRTELPVGAAPDRGGRPVRYGEHVRDGVRRDHVGYTRVSAVQPDLVLSRPGGADVRHGLLVAIERTGRARAAQQYDGG